MQQIGEFDNLKQSLSVKFINQNVIQLLFQLDNIWPPLTIIYDNKVFQLKQYIQVQNKHQFNEGYWFNMIKMHRHKKLMSLMHIIDMIKNLINRYNRKNKIQKFNEWQPNDSITFLKTLNPRFKFDLNSYWNLEGIIQFINVNFQQFDMIYYNDNQKYQIEKIQKLFSKIFQPLYNHIKQNSLQSKNHWLRYVDGNNRARMYGKSGKFSIKRFLQQKKYFYYRSSKTEGDLQLQKKMQLDYQQFIKANTQYEIHKKLKQNNKLIYIINDQCLINLIKKKNVKIKQCITKQINSRLNQKVQQAILQLKINDPNFLK